MKFAIKGEKTELPNELHLERTRHGITLCDSEGWRVCSITEDGHLLIHSSNQGKGFEVDGKGNIVVKYD